MTPPLFLVPELGTGPSLLLTGAEAHHAATVKRLAVGERVLLADGRGGVAEAAVTEVARDRVLFAVLSRTVLDEPRPRYVVVQALPKGERAELAVEVLTELGVDEIVPWSAERSISVWKGEKAERGVQKWQRVAAEAAKQSRRPRIPVVAALAGSAQVAARIATAGAAYVLHEDAAVALAAAARTPDAGPGADTAADAAAVPAGEVLLVVGPEGGVSPAELAAFTAAGAVPVRLGPEVLRTSTAGAAALAVLSVAHGRWR